MRSKIFFPAVIGALFLCITSFSPRKAETPKVFTDYFSIDALPASWKESKSVIKAINLIIPSTVQQLQRSTSCLGCNAPYSIELLLENPIIVSQSYEDISNKRKNGGYSYECVTVFKFKSSLAVYDNNKQGITKVQITSPTEYEFVLRRKFNLFQKKGVAKMTPDEYITKNSFEVGPSPQVLTEYAEKELYNLRDEIHKLLNRH